MNFSLKYVYYWFYWGYSLSFEEPPPVFTILGAIVPLTKARRQVRDSMSFSGQTTAASIPWHGLSLKGSYALSWGEEI